MYVCFTVKKHRRNLLRILTDAEIVDCCFPTKIMSLPGRRCLLLIKGILHTAKLHTMFFLQNISYLFEMFDKGNENEKI